MRRRDLLRAGALAPILSAGLAQAAEEGAAAAVSSGRWEPPSGRPWNAILVSGGAFSRYPRILEQTARGRDKLDVIQNGNVAIPEASPSTEEMWWWLAENAGGSRIRFLEDGHYCYEWSPELRESLSKEIVERIRTAGDVDLILTLGTEPSLDFKALVDDIPVLCLGSTDPVANGIVPSVEDSGKDNLHATVIVEQFEWQIERFYSIFRFKRLGLMGAEVRRRKSGVEAAKRFCAQRGVEFVEEYYDEEERDPYRDYERMRAAMQRLIDAKVDAVYLPFFLCPNDKFPEFLSMLTSRGIPSFTQAGVDPVERGILLGVAETDMENYGLFEARVIDLVTRGVKPRLLDQRFAQSQGLVINLKTAMQMGWQPPLGLLVSVEDTFSTHSPLVK